MEPGKIIFLHLPKTGGTTLRAIFNQQYGSEAVCGIYDGDPGFISHEDFNALSPIERSTYQVYCGHLPYGLHKDISEKIDYYAMFRKPIERIISYYHHTMTHAPAFKENPVSLLKFLNRQDRQIDNLYTRFISGQSAEFGKCSTAMLFQAMENIDHHFVTVGLQEQFDKSIELLSNKLNWRPVEYTPINVGHRRPSKDYFSHQEIDRISNMNKLDHILYGFVEKRFQEEVAKQEHQPKER
jgi:hypothetical protein